MCSVIGLDSTICGSEQFAATLVPCAQIWLHQASSQSQNQTLKGGSGKWAGVEVYSAPGKQVDSNWLEFSECVSIGNAQLTLNVAAFHFVVNTKCGLELFQLYMSLDPAEGSLVMEDSKFLTVDPQWALPPQPVYQNLLSVLFKSVWE